jgi:RNA polymerase sigma-70 factor (ECF subfamily)
LLQQEKETLFIKLLEDNKAKIFRICRAYVQEEEGQKDLFQEVVYHLWQSLDSFRGESNIKPWVYRVALNVCIRSKLQLQKKQARQVPLESISFQYATIEKDHLEEKEARRLLYSCIASLKESDKALLILYLEDIPYKEIASIAGISENHVAVKLKRIREKLSDCMKKSGYGR